MHWNMWLFFPAAGWAALVAVVAVVWARRTGLGAGGIWKPLPGATGNWTAGQSWAANLTAAGTVVTGLLAASSPVIKTVLGTTAPGKLAAMFVASAVASACAGGATIVTATFRKKGDVFTWAVVVGCWVGLAGTGGQLLVIADQASHLPLDGLTAAAWPLLGVGALLLTSYGVAGLHELLTPPPIPAPGMPGVGSGAATRSMLGGKWARVTEWQGVEADVAPRTFFEVVPEAPPARRSAAVL
jgi:hypothetical protein